MAKAFFDCVFWFLFPRWFFSCLRIGGEWGGEGLVGTSGWLGRSRALREGFAFEVRESVGG